MRINPQSAGWLQRLLVGYLPVIENKLTSDLMAAQNTRENIDPTSGSDQEDGLIWGYHFGPDQPAQPITSQAAVEFLTAPGPAYRVNSSGCIFRFRMRLLSPGYGGM